MKILTQRRKERKERKEREKGVSRLLDRCPTKAVGVVAGLICIVFIGWTPTAFAQSKNPRFRATVDLTWDSNVSRSQGDDRFDDMSAGFDVNASLPWRLTERTRVVFLGNLGAEAFDEFKGLSRTYASVQGEFQYRRSGEFGAPIWGFYVRQGADWYRSALRDGNRTSAGVSVRKPWTDRVFLFGTLYYNVREARSDIFDTREIGLRGNLDYSLLARQTLYLGMELRRGDIVSTARPRSQYAAIAQAWGWDDVFSDTPRHAYRIDALTALLSLGYNIALSQDSSLDFAYRLASSRSSEQPANYDAARYTGQQVSAAFLMRF
jgi:hypothetical protein